MNIAAADGTRPGTGASVLEHIGSPQGDHFDWLVERPDTAREHRLVAFRTLVRPDLEPGAFDAVRIGEHRAAYLAFEGELTRGRGSVRRVARGLCVVFEITDERIVWAIDWGDGPRRTRGARVSGDRWRFEPADPGA